MSVQVENLEKSMANYHRSFCREIRGSFTGSIQQTEKQNQSSWIP